MASSIALYAFVVVTLRRGWRRSSGPCAWLGIRNRRLAVLVLAVGVGGAWHVLDRTVLANYVTAPATKLDEFAPIYQFSESEVIPVHASAEHVYESIFRVTAAEIPFYRTLVVDSPGRRRRVRRTC